MSQTLAMYVDGRLVGHLYDQRPLAFEYTSECLSGLLSTQLTRVIALQAGKISTPAVHAYFENLLPEGDQRRALEDQHHVTSIFGLLSVAGGDTAGAVVLELIQSAVDRPTYRKHTWEQIAQMIVGNGVQAASAKASVSGAQFKILLSIDQKDGAPLLPVGSTASTHILKPDIKRVGQKIWASAINETIMMRAAKKCDLRVASVDYQPTVQSCLVQRYDRIDAGGLVQRLNQFDLCQLLETPSDVKYEADGGPSFTQCYKKIKASSSNPLKDCDSVLKWLFFNLYIGNNDTHAKNLSMLVSEGEFRLAPFYDLMCTSVYSGFSNSFAFKVGATFKPGEMVSADLLQLAASLDMSDRYLFKISKDMAQQIIPAIDESINELQDSFSPTEKLMAQRLTREVSKLCKKRSRKFLS